MGTTPPRSAGAADPQETDSVATFFTAWVCTEGGVVMAKSVKKKDLGRFADTYNAAAKEKQSLCLQLITNAVFMEEQLTKLQAEIREKGVVSEYKNGENQYGTRKSPEVDVYNAMIKNYTSVIKQINDLLPDAPPADDELTKFLKNRSGGAK